MNASFIVKAVPGSVSETILPGDVRLFSYPDAGVVTPDMSYNDGDPWDVWLMMAESPSFAAQPGDSILGAWDIETGVAIPDYPFDQALYDDVQPIGNEINIVTNTFDGPKAFTQHHSYLGNGVRYWGTVNQYPDDNQSRHVICTRFITEFATQFYHRVRFVLSAPFDKDNAPNALAILIYTDPERQNYFYTPGAFIYDAPTDSWYADTTIGQSPIGHDEPVYYCIALGSAPLNGGGTVPVGAGHESWNWENNLNANFLLTESGEPITDEIGQNLEV